MSKKPTELLDLSRALDTAKEAARQGRRLLLDYFGQLKQVQEKHLAGLVSEADVCSEEAMKRILLGDFPQWEFLGEEESFSTSPESSGEVLRSRATENPCWVVDPLDGTTNYVHGFPIFCISIGLEWHGELLLGLVDVPLLDKTYWATQGGGSFVNGEPIRVSQRAILKDSLLATGFFSQNKPALTEQLKIFSAVVAECRGVRRAGAAAYDLCLVAEGVFDGFWEKNLKPWDTAAGALLVKESGGRVSTYSGDTYSIYGNSILATNSLVHDSLLGAIRKSSPKS